MEDLEAGNQLHLLNAFRNNLQLKTRYLVTLAHASRKVAVNPLKMNLPSSVSAHRLIESWDSVTVAKNPLMNHLVAEGTPEEPWMFL